MFSPDDAYRQSKGLSQQSFFAPEHPRGLEEPTRAQTGGLPPNDLLGVGSEPPAVPGIHIENPSGFSRTYTYPLDHRTMNQPLHNPPYFTTGRRLLRTPKYGTNHQPVQNLNYTTNPQLGQHPHYSTNGQPLQTAGSSADNLLHTPGSCMNGEQLYAANQNTNNHQPRHRHSYDSYDQSAGSYGYSANSQAAGSPSCGTNNQAEGSPSYITNNQAEGSPPNYDANDQPAGSLSFSTDNQSANDQQLHTFNFGAGSQQSPAPDYDTNDQAAYIPSASTNDHPLQSSNYGTNYPPLHRSNYKISREDLPMPDSTNDECLCPAEAAENRSFLLLPGDLVDPPGRRSRIGTPGGGEGDAWEDWVNPDGWLDQTQVFPAPELKDD